MRGSGLSARWWWQLSIVALAACAALASVPAAVVERWFSVGLYPSIQHILTSVSNQVPFAVLDVLIVVVATCVTILCVRAVRRAWRERRLLPLVRAGVRLMVLASALYLVFLGLWGFNYRRVPMTERLVLDRPVPTTADVTTLGSMAVERMNTLYDSAHSEGWDRQEWRDDALVSAFGVVQRAVSDASPAYPGRLKMTLLGRYFEWASVDGMVNPFGLEVLANPDLLPFERPFVAAHEWSHLAGFADESEANLIGWLTCVRASVSSQYSGWLFLYWQVSGELPARARQQLSTQLAAGPRGDLEAVVARIRRGQWPVLRSAGWVVYDQYLKANRVDEGVRSYDAVITLLLRAKFEDGWMPVRRDGSLENVPQ